MLLKGERAFLLAFFYEFAHGNFSAPCPREKRGIVIHGYLFARIIFYTGRKRTWFLRCEARSCCLAFAAKAIFNGYELPMANMNGAAAGLPNVPITFREDSHAPRKRNYASHPCDDDGRGRAFARRAAGYGTHFVGRFAAVNIRIHTEKVSHEKGARGASRIAGV